MSTFSVYNYPAVPLFGCSACAGSGQSKPWSCGCKCPSCNGKRLMHPCPRCQDSGRVSCPACQGRGRGLFGLGKQCSECHGRGFNICSHACPNCRSGADPQCPKCRGTGLIVSPCPTCDARGSIDLLALLPTLEVRENKFPEIERDSPDYVFHAGAFETLSREELLDALELDGVYSKELKRATISTPRVGAIQLSATPFSFNIFLVEPEEYVLVAGSGASEYDGGAVYRQRKAEKRNG